MRKTENLILKFYFLRRQVSFLKDALTDRFNFTDF